MLDPQMAKLYHAEKTIIGAKATEADGTTTIEDHLERRIMWLEKAWAGRGER